MSAEGKTAPVESKNGQRPEGERGGAAKYSLFTWLAVLALLGVWSSMAVVYLDIVDYDSVIGENADQLNRKMKSQRYKKKTEMGKLNFFENKKDLHHEGMTSPL